MTSEDIKHQLIIITKLNKLNFSWQTSCYYYGLCGFHNKRVLSTECGTDYYYSFHGKRLVIIDYCLRGFHGKRLIIIDSGLRVCVVFRHGKCLVIIEYGLCGFYDKRVLSIECGTDYYYSFHGKRLVITENGLRGFHDKRVLSTEYGTNYIVFMANVLLLLSTVYVVFMANELSVLSTVVDCIEFL